SVAVTDINKEVGFPLRVREELRIHLACIKSRHGPAVQSQRSRSNDEISALECRVAKGSLRTERRIRGEQGPKVRLRKQPRKILVELGILGYNHRRGSGYRLVDVARHQRRYKPLFGRRGREENKSGRGGICARRSEPC